MVVRVNDDENPKTNDQEDVDIDVRMDDQAVPSYTLSHEVGSGAVPNFQDHFSLAYPSSYLKFRDREIRIYSTPFSQTIFEKKLNSSMVQVKEVADTSIGLFFLRAWYTLISLLMSGFLFVFCIQLLLFLFLGLAIESGLTSDKAAKDPTGFAGTILSIPYFVNGLASAMTIATTFVVDTWQGQKFLKTMNTHGGVWTDWITFLVFIIVPITVAIVLLFSQVDIWWEVTALVWFVGVLALFVLFANVVVYYEVEGCLEVMAYSPLLNETPAKKVFSWNNIKRAILLCQKQRFSGVETLTHLVYDSDKPFEDNPYDEIKRKHDVSSHYSILSRLTNLPFLTTWRWYKDIRFVT